MHVLLVNISDIKGGASRAAYRLHKALLLENINSQMLVQSKYSDDYTVIGPQTKMQRGIGEIRPTLELLINKFYKNISSTYFSASWLPFSNIVKKINKINPDIVHLHWINGGVMRIEDIAKIKAPIVWSLHDMWAFSDGYHYDTFYEHDKVDSSQNKVLENFQKNNLQKKIYKRKEKTYSLISNITIVGLSKWLYTCAKNSTLLQDMNHIQLPNPIDTNIYKPLNKEIARDIWNLPKNKKLVLFGAMGATSDPRKGFHELAKSMHHLKSKDIEFVIFGSTAPQKPSNFGFPTHYVGNLHDDISLLTLYSAVDVMIVPSLQENLSNAIMESLSCATPVIGFNIGGNDDMIVHKNNGYLATPLDSQDLANGIDWVLNHENYQNLSQNAREKVLKTFDSKIVAKQYIELYQNVLLSKKNEPL